MTFGEFLSHPQIPRYSSILASVLVNGAPRALIAKTKSNQSQMTGGDTFKGPTLLPHVWVPMGGSVL